jgi:hypothetical protein
VLRQALAEAASEVRLDPAWDPVDVLALVEQVARTWVGQPAPMTGKRAARRRSVVRAVGLLFPPATSRRDRSARR